jgi:hypothetical protein
MKENPTVFISYSHDSKEHQDRVLELSNKLRSEGINCSLDQYEDSPPEGWPKWMDRQVKNSDFVLVICTKTYYNRVMGDDDKGLGIKWESTLIYQQLYNAGANNTKFIPIIFEDGFFENIPEPLQGATYYNVDSIEEYDKLYSRLRGVKFEKPDLGKLRELPIKERKTLFVSGLIDHELWDKAKWRNGVSYLYNATGGLPPIFTVLFEDLQLGQEIFKELIKKIGFVDGNERLRLSIVEGDVPNQKSGYFVTIGENADATYKLFDTNDQVEFVALSLRIQKVYLRGGSDNLAMFKKEYEKYGCYYIVPAKQLKDPKKGYGCDVDLNYKILKRKVEFRNYSDIKSKNDPDSLLKSKDVLNYFK